jgi:hypothetical protein
VLGQLVLGVLMFMHQFYVKRIIEDHLARTSENGALNTLDTSASLSSVLTFFLGIFYLQHVINTRIIDAKLERAIAYSPAGAGGGTDAGAPRLSAGR